MERLRTIYLIYPHHSWDSNPQASRYKSKALPTELSWLNQDNRYEIKAKRQQPQTHHWHLWHCQISATTPIYTRSTVNPVCHIKTLYTFLYLVSCIKHLTISVALSTLLLHNFHFWTRFFFSLLSKFFFHFKNACNFKAEIDRVWLKPYIKFK